MRDVSGSYSLGEAAKTCDYGAVGDGEAGSIASPTGPEAMTSHRQQHTSTTTRHSFGSAAAAPTSDGSSWRAQAWVIAAPAAEQEAEAGGSHHARVSVFRSGSAAAVSGQLERGLKKGGCDGGSAL
jgi:hypothetical protein